MIVLELPLAPSVNALWKVGPKKLYKSSEYKSWLEEAGWMIKQQTKDTIDGEYAIHIRALKTKKRRDLDNILKATSDLLVEMRVVEDDSLCMALAAEWSNIGTVPMIVTIYQMGESDEHRNNDIQ